MLAEAGEGRSIVMSGGGSYNRHSAPQAAHLVSATGLLEQAAWEIPIAGNDAPVVVADYGSSQGRNSLAPLGRAITVLRRRAGPDQPVCVFHTDQAQNDFCSLFEVVASDPGSYLQGDRNTFAYAAGRSFYEPLFPPGFVSLGWSSSSAHWLRRVPGPIPDSLQAQFTRDPDALAAYARAAAADWLRFLKCRCSELKPGGRLVVLVTARTETSCEDWLPLREALSEELSAMLKEGFITEAENANLVIPTYNRSRSELLAPFEQGEAESLQLDHLHIFAGPDPIWAAYEADGDSNAFADKWAGFLDATLSPSIAGGLDSGRSSMHVCTFRKRIQDRVRSRFRARPQRMPNTFANLVLSKARS